MTMRCSSIVVLELSLTTLQPSLGLAPVSRMNRSAVRVLATSKGDLLTCDLLKLFEHRLLLLAPSSSLLQELQLLPQVEGFQPSVCRDDESLLVGKRILGWFYAL